MNAIALPKDLETYSGRIMDVDSHEMMPTQEWVKHFGDEIKELADYYGEFGDSEDKNKNTATIKDYCGDILPIDANIVNIKGSRSPGATEMDRRIDVMDAMGVRRQLVYPGNLPSYLMFLYKFADSPKFLPFITGDRLKKAKHLIEVCNEFQVSMTSVSDRLRPIPVLYGDTPAELIARAKSFVKRGVRAVWYFPAGELPGGVSPAHPDLDPLWATLAEANCAVTVHISGDGNFLRTTKWRDAPAFEGFIAHIELSRDPWYRAVMHLPFENFLTVMLLGGVFDRHPNLRFGAIECASYWVGPMIRRLDLWYGMGGNMAEVKFSPGARLYRLPEPPSFYLKRNVRATPFVFEDFTRDIQHYGLEDVLCFSTDYPHVEGGKNAFQTFYSKMDSANLSAHEKEKFFVRNGSWLLPD